MDGYDLDEASVELARANAADHGLSERVRFHVADAADPGLSGSYDLVTIFEALHDVPRPVELLETLHRLAGSDGAVLVMDERVSDSFSAPAGRRRSADVRLQRALLSADRDGSRPPGGHRHGDAGRHRCVTTPSAAGFCNVEVLPIENDFFRVYRLHR